MTGPPADDHGAAVETCPGCETADDNGGTGWVMHRGRWHTGCVAVDAAIRAGLL